MKTAKKVIFTIVIILLCLFAAYNIYNTFCLKFLHKDITTINGYGVLEVVSGSMEPTIHVGDMIIINTKDRHFDEGNVITFYDKEGTFTTHRIIEIEDGKIITQGDNNDSIDNYDLTEDKIVGKYVWRLGGAGKLLAAFKSPLTMIMILIIGILTCILVSTDKDGNPILDKDEKEYEEFLKYKESQEDSKTIEEPIKKDTAREEKPKVRGESTQTKKANTSKSTSKSKKTNTSKSTKNNTTKKMSTDAPKAKANPSKKKKTNTSKKK